MEFNTNWEEYQNDTRTACKYGANCYQKNPKHKNTYKHPPPEESDIKETVNEAKRKRSEEYDEVVEPNLTSPKIAATEAKPEPIDDMPPSPADLKLNIKQKFLVEMPQDFYELFEFCMQLDSNKPQGALESIGLMLGGPYDLVSGKLKDAKTRTQNAYLCHHRFYYDPPEFQTVIIGRGFHIGYYRDHPTDDPVFLAEIRDNKAGIITPVGPTIFAAISRHIKSIEQDGDPFSKTCAQKLHKKLQDFCNKHDICIDSKNAAMTQRNKLVVSKTFHSAGIVVPIDKKTDVGYREIPETNANLKKILKHMQDASDEDIRQSRFEALQELMTNVQWATDEGDFGMGLELGIDLFTFGGSEFHSALNHLLSVAYGLLDRQQFSTILKAHLKDRRSDGDMSRLY